MEKQKEFAEQELKTTELGERELEAAAGGWFYAGDIKDNWDSKTCPALTRVSPICNGDLDALCTNYGRETWPGTSMYDKILRHFCTRPGGFDYKGDPHGNPIN